MFVCFVYKLTMIGKPLVCYELSLSFPISVALSKECHIFIVCFSIYRRPKATDVLRFLLPIEDKPDDYLLL